MLWGALMPLEVRAEGEGVRIRGAFSYDVETELAPGRREVVARGAFSWSDADMLYQHDAARPLASTRAGSLTLRNADSVLWVEASVAAGTSWGRDFLEAHRAGLVTGLSPGFRVAPGGERVERHADGVLRTITAAELVEVSAVTRPAYPAAQIEARAWAAEKDVAGHNVFHPLRRWRL